VSLNDCKLIGFSIVYRQNGGTSDARNLSYSVQPSSQIRWIDFPEIVWNTDLVCMQPFVD